MKKTMKKNLILAGILASSLCLAGAVVATNSVYASANDGQETPAVAFANGFGATVRVSDPNGIRFRIKLSDEKKAEVFGEDSNLTLGMFLFPADKIESANGAYANLAQKLNFTFDEEDLYKQDGYWYANGVMTNMYIQNFTKEFVGVGYIYDGTNYVYADLADNERSMYEIASAAYVDTDPLVTPYKGVMANLLEKAIYSDYGVKEKRNETVVSFNKDGNEWATYEEMKTANPISISVSATETNLLVGETLDLEAMLMVGASEVTLDIPLSYELTGTSVTLENGVVTAATPGKTNVTVSFGEYTQTVAINVVDTQERNHLQGQPDVNMFGTTTEVSLVEKQGNFNGFGSIVGEIESLCIKNGANLSEIENLTIELVDNKLKFTTTEASLVNVLGAYRGNKTVILTTHEKNEDGSLKKIITHNFYLTFADYVFMTAEQYRNFADYIVDENTVTSDTWNPAGSTTAQYKRTNGYFVLGTDLDFKNQVIINNSKPKVALTANSIAASDFKGTLDGQGYTISNATFYNNALVEYIRHGAVVKDIVIKDCKVSASDGLTGIVTRFAGKGYTISDVYAQVNISSRGAQANGLIASQRPYGSLNSSTVKNCVVIASISAMKGSATVTKQGLFLGENTANAGSYTSIKFTNCIGIVTDTNASGYTLSGNFGSVCNMDVITQENCNYFASWKDYNSATLNGYDADMIAFITGYNS